MTPEEPHPNDHVREQVRAIIADEDRTCLGVKVRPPIPVSEQERIALATLRRFQSSGDESASPGEPRMPMGPPPVAD